MCLETDQQKMEVFRRRMPDGPVKMWKVYKLVNQNKKHPRLFMLFQRRSLFVSSDTIRSDRKTKGAGKDRFDISFPRDSISHRKAMHVARGIHVLLRRKEAEHLASWSSEFCVVVPVWTNKRNFVAGNWREGDAVFTQVRLNKNDYQRALEGKEPL